MKILDLFRIINEKESQKSFSSKLSLELRLHDFKINNYTPLNMQGYWINNCEPIEDLENILNKEINEFGVYLYNLIGHTGEWFVREVNSINDAEEYILSPGGYLNMFCTTLLVIYKGKVKDFRVYEILDDGEKQYVEDDEECKNRDKVIVEWIDINLI